VQSGEALLVCALLVVVSAGCGERVLVTEATSPVDTTPVTAPEAQTTVVSTTIGIASTAVPETDAPSTTQAPPVVEPDTIAAVDQTAPPAENPATEHQLDVLAAAFSMPGRPELEDRNGGQYVAVGPRALAVNVPIRGSWQYADIDAQDLPAASAEASEVAARALLAKLGIDAEGQMATFVPNGPSIDVSLGGCTMRFSDDGQVAWAIGAITAIAAS
jgi:hypothetical protein